MTPRSLRALWRSLRSPQASDDGAAGEVICSDDSQGNANGHLLASTQPDVISPGPVYRLDPAKAREHIDRIDCFRILVMGRANAGKTTILQRVCNSTDQPEIFDGEGRKVDATVVQDSLMRGRHNIEDELVFSSNPGFVFHDSCGFEAGSEEEFNMMKKFVMDRARSTYLSKRIHAIWFCIPLNESHRMVMGAEKKFFDLCDTGHVLVIVLLTRADTLKLEAVGNLMGIGLGLEDAIEGSAEEEKRLLDSYFAKIKEQMSRLRFPPHDYLPLGGMHQEGADCTKLLACTANALNEEGLQALLVSVQQSALALCMEFAVMKALRVYMVNVCGQEQLGELSLALLIWFPFRAEPHGLWRLFLWLWKEELLNLKNDIDVPVTEIQLDVLQMPVLSTSMHCTMKHVVEQGIGCILVFEYSYFLMELKEDEQDVQRHITAAVEQYQASGTQGNVMELIHKAFEEHGEDVETLCPILVDIVKDNQMSKHITKK